MRSDALDQLLTGYLEQPVRFSWEGGVFDSLRGHFDGVRLEMAGLATAWLPLERIVVQARHTRFTPGLPATLGVEEPELAITIGERDFARMFERLQLPFRLRFGENGVVVNTAIAGLELSEIEAGLEVVRGWFMLRPLRASILGMPSYVARLLRVFLPIPPLSPEARLIGIDHAERQLTLRFGLDDFEERVTPGLPGRIRRRLLPWGR